LLDPIRTLRPHYRTGVISDALPGARHELRVQAHVNESLFDVTLFSGEEKVKKPDEAIFDKSLSRLTEQRTEAVSSTTRRARSKARAPWGWVEFASKAAARPWEN
jgi:FMN phosphatase YigB (HAD superfamily)